MSRWRGSAREDLRTWTVVPSARLSSTVTRSWSRSARRIPSQLSVMPQALVEFCERGLEALGEEVVDPTLFVLALC